MVILLNGYIVEWLVSSWLVDVTDSDSTI